MKNTHGVFFKLTYTTATHFAALLLYSISIYEQMNIEKYYQKGFKVYDNQSRFSNFFCYISKMENSLHTVFCCWIPIAKNAAKFSKTQNVYLVSHIKLQIMYAFQKKNNWLLFGKKKTVEKINLLKIPVLGWFVSQIQFSNSEAIRQQDNTLLGIPYLSVALEKTQLTYCICFLIMCINKTSLQASKIEVTILVNPWPKPVLLNHFLNFKPGRDLSVKINQINWQGTALVLLALS